MQATKRRRDLRALGYGSAADWLVDYDDSATLQTKIAATADAAADLDGAACPANASFSLRTTGASIVDDGERTNSPIS